MTGQRTSGLAAGRLWAGGRRDGGGGGAGRDRGGVRRVWVVRRSVLVPDGSGTWEGVGTVVYALGSVAGALAATALLHLLLISTPRAKPFFVWIMLLATALAVVVSLSLNVVLAERVATAVGKLFVGLVITGPL